MRVYLTALTIALGCIYWRVSGKLVEVVVRPGDNAILLCDREIVGGQDTHWVKICSSQIQPPLTVSAQQTLLLPISRFSVLWNDISKSFDLMIENITDADLGLYYCSTVEKQIIEHDRLSFEKEVYHTGDTLTKLTYASSDDNECSGSSETHHDSVSECWQCWLILLTVCPACSLFSASLAFLCGKSCYHKKVFKKSRGLPNTSEMQRQEQIQEQNTKEDTLKKVGNRTALAPIHLYCIGTKPMQDDIEEICYTSLNIPKQRSKLKRNNPMPNADNSVYNDIKIP